MNYNVYNSWFVAVHCPNHPGSDANGEVLIGASSSSTAETIVRSFMKLRDTWKYLSLINYIERKHEKCI